VFGLVGVVCVSAIVQFTYRDIAPGSTCRATRIQNVFSTLSATKEKMGENKTEQANNCNTIQGWLRKPLQILNLLKSGNLYKTHSFLGFIKSYRLHLVK